MPLSLPTELWRAILREAIYVPGLLLTTWDLDPEEQIWEGWEGGTPKIDIGFWTKQAIVRVCREWQRMGVELLYETIYISTHLRLAALNATIAASGTTTNPGYGWWTKRVVCPYAFLGSEYAEELFNLLKQCHNIQIFTFSGEEHIIPLSTQQSLVQLLESRFSHSLRRVDINMNPGEPPYYDAIPRIRGLTSLTAMVRNDTPGITDNFLFTHITTLTLHLLDYLNDLPSGWIFPSLRNLSLRGVAEDDVGTLVPFLTSHRETLVHLHVGTTWSENPELPVLFSSTPQILSLTLDKRDLHVLESSTTALPDVTHLGLTHLSRKKFYRLWSNSSLTDILDRDVFPSLLVIRLLDKTHSSTPGHDWTNVIEQCREYGVRLEGEPPRRV